MLVFPPPHFFLFSFFWGGGQGVEVSLLLLKNCLVCMTRTDTPKGRVTFEVGVAGGVGVGGGEGRGVRGGKGGTAASWLVGALHRLPVRSRWRGEAYDYLSETQ